MEKTWHLFVVVPKGIEMYMLLLGHSLRLTPAPVHPAVFPPSAPDMAGPVT